jgi:hypothetical protein
MCRDACSHARRRDVVVGRRLHDEVAVAVVRHDAQLHGALVELRAGTQASRPSAAAGERAEAAASGPRAITAALTVCHAETEPWTDPLHPRPRPHTECFRTPLCFAQPYVHSFPAGTALLTLVECVVDEGATSTTPVMSTMVVAVSYCTPKRAPYASGLRGTADSVGRMSQK